MTKDTSQVHNQTMTGTVVSVVNDKTAVVRVQRFVKHSKYKKFYKVHKRFQVHDENNTAKLGDVVTITKVRPLSKTKHFAIVNA